MFRFLLWLAHNIADARAYFSDPLVFCALVIAGSSNILTCAYFPSSFIFRSAYNFRAYILAGPLLIVGAHIFPVCAFLSDR